MILQNLNDKSNITKCFFIENANKIYVFNENVYLKSSMIFPPFERKSKKKADPQRYFLLNALDFQKTQIFSREALILSFELNCFNYIIISLC